VLRHSSGGFSLSSPSDLPSADTAGAVAQVLGSAEAAFGRADDVRTGASIRCEEPVPDEFQGSHNTGIRVAPEMAFALLPSQVPVSPELNGFVTPREAT
jgi:hypothetical protein